MDTKALRQKILDLAIRGKLVPQDSDDEPASVLLERIREQKKQMVKDGKLKAKDIKNDTIIFVGEDNLHYEKFPDGTVTCIEDEIPFEVPEGWEWTRISTVCLVNPRNTLEDSLQVSFIPMPLIQEGFANNHTSEIKDWGKVKSGFTHFAEGDVAVAKITPCFENRKSVIFSNLKNGYGAGTTELHILRAINILPEYILWIVKSEEFISKGVQAFMGAVGQQRVGKDYISNYIIPIPSLEEQRRIVNKIKEIFSLISSIDTDKSILKSTIQLAKSKILDLAIKGKIVPQDPDDEPASVLLERIRSEKEKLIEQGKIKRDKKESIIFKGEDNSYYEKIGDTIENIDIEIPFSLPDGWIWCRGYSCFAGMQSTKPQGNFFDYIDIDSVDNNLHCIKKPKHISVADAPSRASRAVTYGSVLFSLVRPYLENIALVEETYRHSIASTGFYVCNSNGALLPKFMFYLMISNYVVSGLNQYMKGDNSPSISKDNIENWLYPIPPIEEQKIICSKLNYAFTIIEKLEKNLI